MTDSTNAIVVDQLKAFVERIEREEEEKANAAVNIKDIYTEAKSNGFDAKAIRRIISLRKKDRETRKAEEAVLDLYCEALGLN